MATTLDRPAPSRHRFDVDAYYQMAAAGILTRDDRVELIDGEIIDMAPIGITHAATTDLLNRLAAFAVVKGLVHVGVQRPLHLDRHNEPQPDLMLLKARADGYMTGHPTVADLLLLIEVADTSLAYDRGRKLALYAKHAVPEVWIVDLTGRAVEVCRQPAKGAYTVRERVMEGRLAPVLMPEFVLDVAGLLN